MPTSSSQPVTTTKIILPHEHAFNDDDPYGAYYLYKYIILIQLFLYMEAGIVPALLSQFTSTFDLTPQYQGLLGASVYVALSIATPLCAYCYRNTKRAGFVLGCSLLGNSMALIFFMSAPTGHGRYSRWFLIASRGGVGFTQAFFNVYAPLWVHQYCPFQYRARCMGYLQGSTPLGATIGYFIGSIAIWFSSNGDAGAGTGLDAGGGCYWMLCWRWPLLVPICVIIPLALFMFTVPNEHIMLRSVHLRPSIMMIKEASLHAMAELEVDDADEISLTETSKLLGSPQSSQYASQTSTDNDLWQEFIILIHTPVYICVVLCLTSLFFVVTGIQYWVTLFLISNTQDSLYVIHLSYLFCAGTGPILGVMFGGWIIDNSGGYSTSPKQQTKALGICMILGIIGVVAAIPLSFLHNTYSISFFIWVMLFSGGSILPACSGIVIAAVNPSIRPFASSFAATCYNLLGFAASNYIPGIIMTFVIKYFPMFARPDYLYTLGLRVVLCWSFFALFWITLAWYYSKRQVMG